MTRHLQLLQRLRRLEAAATTKLPKPPDLSGLTAGERFEVRLLIARAGLARAPSHVELDRYSCSPFAPNCPPKALCRGLSCHVCEGLARLGDFDRQRLLLLVRFGADAPRRATPRPPLPPLPASQWRESWNAWGYGDGDGRPVPGIDDGADPSDAAAWSDYTDACLRGERRTVPHGQVFALFARGLCSLGELHAWVREEGPADLREAIEADIREVLEGGP